MSQVADLQRDSDELEAFTRTNLSWQSHADEMTCIGDRTNTLGKTFQKTRKLAQQRFTLVAGGDGPHHSPCAETGFKHHYRHRSFE
jgi:hypothetical protein